MIFCKRIVQTNNKWYAFELNSKSDKTENSIQKCYHDLISKEVQCLYLRLIIFQ